MLVVGCFPIFAASTVEPQQEKLALSPAHPEIPPSFWEQYGGWVIVGAILLLGIAVLIGWWLLRPKATIPTPVEVEVRRELEALLQRNEDGQALSRISRSLRRYLGAAFALPAGETTTAELCRQIAASKTIGPDLAPRLTGFFRHCDTLKFAPGAVSEGGNAVRALELLDAAESRRAQLRQATAATPPVHS